MLKKAAASKGVMGTVVGAGVGGAAYFLAAKAAPKVSFLQSRWWATPTALLVVGHLAKRYSQETGQAVVGAAGALMAFSYYVASASTTTTPAATAAAAKGLMGVGPGEAGSLPGRGGYGEAGAIQRRPMAGAYRRSDAGALVG